MGTSLAVPTFWLRVPSPPREQSPQEPRGPAPNGASGASGVPGPPGPVVPAGRALKRDLAAAEAEPWPDASGDRRPAAEFGSGRAALKGDGAAGSCRGGTSGTGPGTSGGPGGEGLSRPAQDPVPIPPSCPGVCGGGGIHPRHCPRSRVGSWLCAGTYLKGGGVENVGPAPHPSIVLESLASVGVMSCVIHSVLPWTQGWGALAPSQHLSCRVRHSWMGMGPHLHPGELLENLGWMDAPQHPSWKIRDGWTQDR